MYLFLCFTIMFNYSLILPSCTFFNSFSLTLTVCFISVFFLLSFCSFLSSYLFPFLLLLLLLLFLPSFLPHILHRLPFSPSQFGAVSSLRHLLPQGCNVAVRIITFSDHNLARAKSFLVQALTFVPSSLGLHCCMAAGACFYLDRKLCKFLSPQPCLRLTLQNLISSTHCC